MLIYLLNSVNKKEKKFLRTYLNKPRIERSADETEYIMDLMRKYKSIEKGKVAAKNLAGAGLKEFYTLFSAFPETEEKAFLENMILYMINRDK
jgi:geranylgeranyl diphosphate synthase type II